MTKKDEKVNVDRLVRVRANSLTGTKYHFYDCRDGSKLFDLNDGDRYIVAILETGEWKGFSRRNTHKDSAVVNMHPYAKWAPSEVRIMRIKEVAGRMSILINHCLNGDFGVDAVEKSTEKMISAAEKNIAERSEEE